MSNVFAFFKKCGNVSPQILRYRGIGGYTLTKLGRELLGRKSVRGPEYFKVKGEDETLVKRMARIEGKS